MSYLSQLKDSSSKFSRKRRVGRGIGSGNGKTCGRGHKGFGSRSGYRRRYGDEGGQFPLFRKVPCRGFTRAAFATACYSINLGMIENLFEEKEVLSVKTLIVKKILPKTYKGKIKILSQGELKKKVSIEADEFSKKAQEKLDKNKIPYKMLKPQKAS